MNRANQPAASRLRALIGAEYEPIDWQLDFKSGYRWSESTWYRDVRFGHVPGADVKVPWELGRLQHLPRLALAALLSAHEGDNGQAQRFADEVRNQVLDFVAGNPPRYGVQWVTAMDVAIRAANMLVAWDLCEAAGASFDEDFIGILARSCMEHGHHIFTNLEWSETARGNHYLADVVGLLFVAAYLPAGPRTVTWLRFAAGQVISEVRRQFLDDGANFEGSTSYHGLSAEMAAYGVAMLLALPEPRTQAIAAVDLKSIRVGLPTGSRGALPTWTLPGNRTAIVPIDVLERLGRAGRFTAGITKPDGRVPQFGDNDNGRFLDLVPIVRVLQAPESLTDVPAPEHPELPGTSGPWLVTDHLDHAPLLDAIDGLLGRLAADREPRNPAYAVIWALARPAEEWASLGESHAEAVRIGNEEILRVLGSRLAQLPDGQRLEIRIDLPGPDVLAGARLLGYPDFGIFVIRTDRLYLAVRCGPVGQNGRGGHDHNDQLVVELSVDGDDWIRDPGTYVYTALPRARNAYRSARAHFVPQLSGSEPAHLDRGLFELGRGSAAACLYWGDEGFAGRLRTADGRVAFCIVRPAESALLITHAAEGATLRCSGVVRSDWRSLIPDLAYSPGYGILER